MDESAASHGKQKTELVQKDLTERIIAAAFEVHSCLGPGLLESVYRRCLVLELSRRSMRVQTEVIVPVRYKGVAFEEAYRLDILVEGMVIVEIKSLEKLAPIHEAQLLTYLRLYPARVGLLLNFGVPHLKDGLIRRVC